MDVHIICGFASKPEGTSASASANPAVSAIRPSGKQSAFLALDLWICTAKTQTYIPIVKTSLFITKSNERAKSKLTENY